MTTPPDKPTPPTAPNRRRRIIITSVLLSAVAIGGVIAACSSQGTARKNSVAVAPGRVAKRDRRLGASICSKRRESSVVLHRPEPNCGSLKRPRSLLPGFRLIMTLLTWQ